MNYCVVKSWKNIGNKLEKPEKAMKSFEKILGKPGEKMS
jgi:hypothetical protein